MFYVAQLDQPVADTVSLTGGQRREVSSLFSPWTSDFWLIDLNTLERSRTNALDLAPVVEEGIVQWQPYAETLPVLSAGIYLDAAEAGRTFTLHSRAPGGPENFQSFALEPLNVTEGSWDPGYVDVDGTIHTVDHTGAEIVVPPGSGAFRAPVGLGMEFWLSRDLDGASSPIQVAINSGAPQWALFGSFPPRPERLTTTVTFTVPDAWVNAYAGSPPYVLHQDGWTSPASLQSRGTWTSYDASGQVLDTCAYAKFIAEVDDSQDWRLVADEGTWGAPYPPKTTLFIFEWNPSYTQPPSGRYGILRLAICADRFSGSSALQFCQSDGSRWEIPPASSQGTVWTTVQYWVPPYTIPLTVGGVEPGSVVVDGQISIPVYYVTVPFDSEQAYWVEENTGGSSTSPVLEASPVNTPDLSQWFHKVHFQLALSTSRWGHSL